MKKFISLSGLLALLITFTIFPVKAVETDLPGEVTDLTIEPGARGALTATLKWKWPAGENQPALTGAKIYRSTSSSCEAVSDNLIHTMTGEYQGGADAEYIDLPIPAAGKYYYRVMATNANGDSPAGVLAIEYIGEDTYTDSPRNVQATLGSDLQTVTLTWEAPVKGGHGGYIDPEKITYRVCRITITLNHSQETIIADNLKSCSYTDVTDPGHSYYKYRVETLYGEGEHKVSGFSALSDEIETGRFTVPYSNNFQGYKPTGQWQFFENTGEGNYYDSEWELYTNASNNKMLICTENNADREDAYAVLPALPLDQGKAYEISYKIKNESGTTLKHKTIHLVIGTAASVEGLSKELESYEVEGDEFTVRTTGFNVGESGDYYIALRATGEGRSFPVYVDDISVTEVKVVANPVTDVEVIIATEGVLTSAVRWTNPTHDIGGNPLETLSKVEIYCNGILSETLSDTGHRNPGEKCTWFNNLPEPGIYTYKIVPYVGDEAGRETEVTSAWIGHDTPKPIAKVEAVYNDDGSRLLTFDAVTESVHGGYLTEPLSYKVYRNGTVIAENVESSPYIDSEAGLAYDWYHYEVAAVSNGNESDPMGAELRFGEPLSLPYEPDFTTERGIKSWTIKPHDRTAWVYNSVLQTLEVDYVNSWAFTPPFNADSEEITVTMNIRNTCILDFENELTLYLVQDTVIPSRTQLGVAPRSEAAEFKPIKISDIPIYMGPARTYTRTVTMPAAGSYRIAFGTLKVPVVEQIHLSDVLVGRNITTGVENVAADPDEARRDIYNLQGILIRRSATRADLMNLAPGLYIFGCEKVLVQ